MFNLPGHILSNTIGELLADVFGQSPREWAEQRAVQRKIRQAVDRAERQFAASYAAVDPELTELLVLQTRFADLPSVRAALHELLTRPLHDPTTQVAVLRRSFTELRTHPALPDCVALVDRLLAAGAKLEQEAVPAAAVTRRLHRSSC